MKTKVCLICTLIIVSIFITTIILSPIYSDNSPWANGGNMAGSLDAAVHENITRQFDGDPVKLHVHTIAYAHRDHHQFGAYSIGYKFELTDQGEEMRKRQNNQKIEGADYDADEFDDGCNVEFDINREYPWQGNAWTWDNDYLKRRIGSTIESYESVIVMDDKGEPKRDWNGRVIRKKIKPNKVKASDFALMVDGEMLEEDPGNGEGGEGGGGNPSGGCLFGSGLFPGNGFNNITINGEEMVDTAPGDTVTVDLVMPSDRGYSQIYWYLAGPNDSGLGNGVGAPTSPSGTEIGRAHV